MQTTQEKMLVSLRSVEDFLNANAAALKDVINTGARQKLTAAIAQLTAHASDQTGTQMAQQGSTRGQESLRRALMRDHMAPIARIARAELATTPEIEPLRMPRGRPTSPKLAAAADGMTKAAAKHAAVFVAQGLPDDFIAQLNTAAEALLQSLSGSSIIRGERKTATKSLKVKLSAGRKIVHILDAYVQSALKNEPALLDGWNSVKRVQNTGLRLGGTTTPQPTTPKPGTPGASVPTGTPAATATPAPTDPTKPALAVA